MECPSLNITWLVWPVQTNLNGSRILSVSSWNKWSFKATIFINITLCFLTKCTSKLRTFSLCSLRLMMTAVICWSININIQANRAGSGATKSVHAGFPPKGLIIHPRAGRVGSNFSGTSSFGVSSPIIISAADILTMAITTAKSLIMQRT